MTRAVVRRPLAVLILAGGRGRRLPGNRPKVLQPVANRPMIGYVLEAARALEPEAVIAVIPPSSAALRRAMGAVRVALQDEPSGTADAVRCGLTALGDFSGDVIVLCADTPLLRPATLRALRRALEGGDAELVVAAMRLSDGRRYGRLRMEGERLQAIVEYNEADAALRENPLCNAGILMTSCATLRRLLPEVRRSAVSGEYYLTEVVELLTRSGGVARVFEGDAFELHGVNTPRELMDAEAAMQQRLREKLMERGVFLQDPFTLRLSWDADFADGVVVGPFVWVGSGVAVDRGTEIRAFCHLEGVHIGQNAVIGPFARLRPGTIIGNGASVGNFVELKNARIGAEAKVNHLTYAGDAEIGGHANVGAGVVTCNYDGYAKAKTVIGERAFIGSNCSLVAPVTIRRDAAIAAGSVITDNVEEGALAVARSRQSTVPGWTRRRRARREPSAA